MDEFARLTDLYSYKILDTDPEEKFDEITKLASLICETPVSLISLVDKDRQWFKSVYGIDLKQTLKKDGFCHYLIDGTSSLFEIKDASEDLRFKTSPLVTGYPHIGFYAGAPIKSSSGHVLGALCVIDQKPNSLKDNQKEALKILANKTTEYLNTRKVLIDQQKNIEFSATRLKEILDNTPGVIFQLRIQDDFEISFDFISKGIKDVHEDLSLEKMRNEPKSFLNYIHPEDVVEFRKSMRKSATTLSPYKFNFRVISPNTKIKWYKVRVIPKRIDGETIVWFGTLMDISGIMEYETILEQITYDISHVIRKPLTTLMGLNENLKNHSELDETDLREYADLINIVTDELDIFTRKIDQFYQLKVIDHQNKLYNNFRENKVE
ncbi:GAF domain-containing protein [Zunongwangia endophytica]|uniref:histidine kinase n=1 Tax=Zunongwangia endophytica TaxID=1808945 RepID=A0ABV8HDW1_9FLAO|nr:GAF domain-containing protein [Zunongwangia endophytica]MDN3593946.1 PAS domain-containing protein [Zunongwangia endophytica]